MENPLLKTDSQNNKNKQGQPSAKILRGLATARTLLTRSNAHMSVTHRGKRTEQTREPPVQKSQPLQQRPKVTACVLHLVDSRIAGDHVSNASSYDNICAEPGRPNSFFKHSPLLNLPPVKSPHASHAGLHLSKAGLYMRAARLQSTGL